MTRVTVALVDLLVQILLKTILYLLETTLFGAPMSANNYVFLRTLLLLLSLSLSFLPYRSSCLNVLFFEIIMFECFWRFLKLYIWNRMHALHVHPIWRMIQEVSASWTIQVSQACRHTFWHFTLKKKLNKEILQYFHRTRLEAKRFQYSKWFLLIMHRPTVSGHFRCSIQALKGNLKYSHVGFSAMEYRLQFSTVTLVTTVAFCCSFTGASFPDLKCHSCSVGDVRWKTDL